MVSSGGSKFEFIHVCVDGSTASVLGLHVTRKRRNHLCEKPAISRAHCL